MPKLPQISGRELGRALTRLGFIFTSQRGSHMKFTRAITGRKEIVVIPNHKIIRKGLLLGVLKQVNLNVEKLKGLL